MDEIRFPLDLELVCAFLTRESGVKATGDIPKAYTENLLVSGTSHRTNLVQQTTLYVIEARAATTNRAWRLASTVEALLEAWCRTTDDGPYDYNSVSLVTNLPDPDDGKPRSILTCEMTWDRL